MPDSHCLIDRPTVCRQQVPWQQAMKQAVRDPAELCEILQLPPEVKAAAVRAAQLFPLFAPRPFVSRMRPHDPTDPLLRQVLPLDAELVSPPSFSRDPVGDRAATLEPGLIQKYHGRALIVATGACAVHCRYCFRRHFPYDQVPHSVDAWDSIAQRLAQDASIHEVILSGGDPLTLRDDSLEQLVSRLADIPHLQRLRIHTRLPIVIPQRVTSRLIRLLTAGRLTPLFVVHVNHPAEIDHFVTDALDRLARAGIPLLNQSVLLSGINDDVEVLARLCEQLVNLRVMPYYLHQLDRVDGAAHFEVSVERGRQLVQALRSRLPGYAVPRYVQEIAGEPHKVPLMQ